MWTKREVIIFLAGVEAFHTLSHLAMGVSGALPMRFFGFTVTAGLNALGIVVKQRSPPGCSGGRPGSP